MPKKKHQKPSEIAKADASIPPPPDKQFQCHFWVKRKHRYCNLITKAKNKYCGEHLTEEQRERKNGAARPPEKGTKPNKARVPCPYDPSHTVYETQLADHLANRCNSRPRPPDSWISPNCNVTLPLTTEELEFQQNIRSHKEHKVQPWIARVQLAELTRPDLDGLVAKVRGVFEREVREIRMEVLDHEAMRERRQLVQFNKHTDQHASLLGHMKRLGMLDDKSACFIEFGAGRGELSSYLKAAVNDTQGEATYMLVDRKNVRGKFDKNLIGSHPALKSTVKRVGCDIKDLDLSRIDILQGGEKKVVALSKHLCGSATDITLKCLVNYLEKEREKGNGSTIAGIVIAICCHQLCRWPMYPNPTFLADIGFTQADFERVCKMTSWAICGQRPEAVEAEEEQEHELAGEEEGDADDTGAHYSGLDHTEREVVGYQCKRILDTGRARFLEQHGFDVELVYYVEPRTSLENCALLAVPRRA